MKRQKSARQLREERLDNLVDAALDRYSHEELFLSFLRKLDNWKEREVVAKMIVENDSLLHDVFSECSTGNIDSDCVQKACDIVRHKGYEIFECTSLVQQMRFEQFKEEIESNPYQLQLIA